MRLLLNQFSCLPKVYKILIGIMRLFMHYKKVYSSSGFIVLESGPLPEINSV